MVLVNDTEKESLWMSPSDANRSNSISVRILTFLTDAEKQVENAKGPQLEITTGQESVPSTPTTMTPDQALAYQQTRVLFHLNEIAKQKVNSTYFKKISIW